jgi:hypothetical protein
MPRPIRPDAQPRRLDAQAESPLDAEATSLGDQIAIVAVKRNHRSGGDRHTGDCV